MTQNQGPKGENPMVAGCCRMEGVLLMAAKLSREFYCLSSSDNVEKK